MVAMIEAGLLFSAEAELTGEAGSALTLLLEGWKDDDDDNDVWGAGRVAVLG